MSADRDLIKASGPLGIVGYRRMPMWRRLLRWISAPSPWY